MKRIPLISGTVLCCFIMLCTPAIHAQEQPDYEDMVRRIGVFFEKGMELYEQGRTQEAKQRVQSAYFEVFENLEGPIRINISAKKNFLLEEEFVGIRKMVVAGEPAQVIQQRIDALMADLKNTIAELEGGHVLVAEGIEGETPADNEQRMAVEPVWQQAYDAIRTKLQQAVVLYEKGEAEEAKELVIKAQFDDYKNTLLEAAVRRYVSMTKDYENNDEFSVIIALIHNKGPVTELRPAINTLLQHLHEDLPGLPLVEGAISARQAEKMADAIPDKDWVKITKELFSAIEKAVALYETGDAQMAAIQVQDIYFDIFEASGMEAKVGSRDPAMKAELEAFFVKIVGQMKKGVPVADIREELTAMRTAFNVATDMLGTGADSPYALFFYSLMIILREGFEAILVITAIITYLIKTGNGEKTRVVYGAALWALALSVVTAVVMELVLDASAASQEALEGGTMLLATLVLFFVSYWLISKAEARKWSAYIQSTVDASVASGSMKALWFAAFLAVYREGAETVLFYTALVANQSAAGLTGIAIGFVVGCFALVILYLVMRYTAVKLPLRPFFLFTGGLLYYMAFVFAGKGMLEFIEGKIIEPSLITGFPTIAFMGIYPYRETLAPQLLLVAAAVVGIIIVLRQNAAQKLQ